MKGGFNRNKSLQEIERHDWGEPTYQSYLVTTCHQLRRKPLAQFTVEDLRIMIGQQISLPILIPLAVERLEADPLAEGHYYPGDLLFAVLSIDRGFWSTHPDSAKRVNQVVQQVRHLQPTLDEITAPSVARVLADVPPELTTAGKK
jgi:hypothetical protein